MNVPGTEYAWDVLEAAQHLTSFLSREGFHLVATYRYTHLDGSPWWWVLRLEGSAPDPTTDKMPKRIFPMRRNADGNFELKRPEFGPEGLPLYGLWRLTAYPHDIYYLAEGEKCADCLSSLGFLGITWHGGAAAVERTNWSPLAGRFVLQWPDNDQPGFEAMKKAKGILYGQGTHVATVDVAALDLPPKGDVVDWLDRYNREHGKEHLHEIRGGFGDAGAIIESLPLIGSGRGDA